MSLNPCDFRDRDYLSSHRWQGQDIPVAVRSWGPEGIFRSPGGCIGGSSSNCGVGEDTGSKFLLGFLKAGSCSAVQGVNLQEDGSDITTQARPSSSPQVTPPPPACCSCLSFWDGTPCKHINSPTQGSPLVENPALYLPSRAPSQRSTLRP